MKNSFWKILLGASVLSLLFLASCAGDDAPSASTGGESTGDGGSVTTECEHGLVRVAASTPTCEIDGAVEHYLCWKCNQYYLDANAETATTQDEVVLSALGHDLSKTEAVAPTCSSDGNVEYYTCSTCGKYFADEAATQRLTEAELTEKGGHLLTKTKAKAATCTEDGNIEHYACGRCGKYYLEASATTEITAQEAVL